MSLRVPVTNKDHIEGNAQGAIEIVEYGDYQCPYCGEFYYVAKALQKQLGNKLKFIFRHFPLDVHPNALHAAIAAEVMATQGKFWEMHDMLYENQDNLDDNALLDYAKSLGINPSQFKTEFSKSSHINKVEADLEGGLRSGVNGTPSLFINGQKYQGDYSFDALLSYLENRL